MNPESQRSTTGQHAGASRSGRARRAGLRAGRWAANTAIVLVIAACVAWLAPSAFGYSRYVITGGSMTGAIDKGSIAFEKNVAVDDLEVGDVITYLPPAGSGVATLVTHRITAMEPAEGGGVLFTTQGDANATPDPWHFKLTDSEQPVVQFHVPHAGWVFIALADRQTRMLIIGLPAALVALYALGQLLGAARGSRLREDASTTPPPTVAHAVPLQRSGPVGGSDEDRITASPELV